MDDLATDIGQAPDFDDINGLVQQTGAAARAAAAKGDGATAKALGIIRDHLDDFEASAMMTSDQLMPKDIFNGLRKSAREEQEEEARREVAAQVYDPERDLLLIRIVESSGSDDELIVVRKP